MWGKPLSQRVDTKQTGDAVAAERTAPAIAVVLFNKGAANTTVTLYPGGWMSSDFYPASIEGEYEVRDLLAQKDLGVHRGDFVMDIPAEDAVMLQIVAVRK